MPKILKKIIITILILSILLLLYFKYKFSLNTYDINKSPLAYNLKKDEYKSYFKYIANYIKPIELKNFVNYDTLNLLDYNEKATGYDVLDYMTYKAYIEMFNNLFDCNLTSYSTFPVTSNFVSKFNICPHKYFCLLGDKVNCYINKDKNEIIVYDYKENEDEEYEYLYYCYFNYKITTEGFIDDIMLNYIK